MFPDRGGELLRFFDLALLFDKGVVREVGVGRALLAATRNVTSDPDEHPD